MGVLVTVVLAPGLETMIVVVLTPMRGVVVMEPLVITPSVGVGGPGAGPAAEVIEVVDWAYALAGASRPSAKTAPATTLRTPSIVASPGRRIRCCTATPGDMAGARPEAWAGPPAGNIAAFPESACFIVPTPQDS
ncbi:MAG TPA: hypothetical protein VED18_01295 [Candidatus Sulfotelmatobacter sp.]|nr:hypothetical protein [Candidatus Sulfotelmatobacter sp.]